MRLKTKLAAAITGLVFLVVLVLSWLYTSQLLRQHVEQSYNSTEILAHQLLFTTSDALEINLPKQTIDVNDPASVHAAVADSLRDDHALHAFMNSVINYVPTVFDIAIVDRDGVVLVSAPDASLEDQIAPKRPDYATLRNQSFIDTLKIV